MAEYIKYNYLGHEKEFSWTGNLRIAGNSDDPASLNPDDMYDYSRYTQTGYKRWGIGVGYAKGTTGGSNTTNWEIMCFLGSDTTAYPRVDIAATGTAWSDTTWYEPDNSGASDWDLPKILYMNEAYTNGNSMGQFPGYVSPNDDPTGFEYGTYQGSPCNAGFIELSGDTATVYTYSGGGYYYPPYDGWDITKFTASAYQGVFSSQNWHKYRKFAYFKVPLTYYAKDPTEGSTKVVSWEIPDVFRVYLKSEWVVTDSYYDNEGQLHLIYGWETWGGSREGGEYYIWSAASGACDVPFGFKVHGTADLHYSDDNEGNYGGLHHTANQCWYHGKGTSNGEMGLFLPENMSMHDIIPYASATLWIGNEGNKITWSATGLIDNTTECHIGGSLADSRADLAHALAGLAPGQQEYANAPVDIDTTWATATLSDNFRASPEADRYYEYNNASGYHSSECYNASGTNSTMKFTYGARINGGTITCHGGWHGGMLDTGNWIYWHSEWDGWGYHAAFGYNHLKVLSGQFTISYEPDIKNLYGEHRSDLVIKGNDRHQIETVVPMDNSNPSCNVTGWVYSYDTYGDYIDLNLNSTVHYKGVWESHRLGNFTDIPGFTFGGASVQGVPSVCATGYASGGIAQDHLNLWSEPSIGCPTHPKWLPFPEGYKYHPDVKKWVAHYGNYHQGTDEYGHSASNVNGMPWYDNRCSIYLADMSVDNAITLNFADGGTYEATISTPIHFTASGMASMSVTGVTQTASGFITGSGSTHYATKDIFSQNKRLTGARFAKIKWHTHTANASFQIRFGNESQYHAWNITTPADYTLGSWIWSEIDLCYPDVTVGITTDMAQTIVPYEQPLDRSHKVNGEIGVRNPDESTYNYLLPAGMGIGRIRSVMLNFNEADTEYYLDDLTLIWKSAADGGIRKVLVVPFEPFIDDRSPEAWCMSDAGKEVVTSSDGLSSHDNPLYMYPAKAVVIVDGAIVMEIPTGYYREDNQEISGDNPPAPYYYNIPFKISDNKAWPMNVYPTGTIHNNGACSYTANTGSMTELQAANCYNSFLREGVYDFMGKDTLDIGMDFRFTSLTIAMGLGVAVNDITGLQHIQWGCVYGLAKPYASGNINVNCDLATPGQTKVAVTPVNKIGWFFSESMNTKGEVSLPTANSGAHLLYNTVNGHLIYNTSNGHLIHEGGATQRVPIDNRQHTRVVI